MKKIYIEVQYDESNHEIGVALVQALSQAEFARVTGDNEFTVVRGELQYPKPRPATTFKRGGVW